MQCSHLFFPPYSVKRKHQNIERKFPPVINKVLGFGLMKYELMKLVEPNF